MGATDAIVDIVGTCLGLDWLKVDGLVCSPLVTGGGTVRCEHGLLPVPAPAVLSMMASANMPVYSNGIERELVTPTGCAIAAALADSFGPPPRFNLQKVGLGAGGRDLVLPNILRLWIGMVAGDRAQPAAHVGHTHAEATAKEVPGIETVVELQTQLDDISPQAIAYVLDRLLQAASVESDETRRLTLYQQAETVLLDDAPITPLYHGTQAYLIRPEVHGWPPTLLGLHRYQYVSLQSENG